MFIDFKGLLTRKFRDILILKQSFLSLLYRILTLFSGLYLYKVVFEEFSTPNEKVLITTAIATLGSLNLLDFGIGHGFRNLFQKSNGKERKLLLVNLFVQNAIISCLFLLFGVLYSVTTKDYFFTSGLFEMLRLSLFILLALFIRPVRFIWLAKGKAQYLVLQQAFVNAILIVVITTMNSSISPFLVVLGFLISQVFFYSIGLMAVISEEGKFWRLGPVGFRVDTRIIKDGLKIFVSQVVAFVSYGLLPYYMSKNTDQDQSLSFNYWWKLFSSLNGIVTMVMVPIWHGVAASAGNKGLLRKIYYAGLGLVSLYGLLWLLVYVFEVNLVSLVYAVDLELYKEMVALLALLSTLLVLTAFFGNIWNGQSRYEVVMIGAVFQLITFVVVMNTDIMISLFPVLYAVLISTFVGFLASLVYVKVGSN